MDITTALTIAIDVIWPELPALVGDGWPAFATALTPLLQQLEDDPAHASITRAQILALFGQQPAAHVRLVELMLEAQSGSLEAASASRNLAAMADEPSAPAPLIRYTDITCPRRVWVATPRFSVVVRLTRQRPEYSAALAELKLDPALPLRAWLEAPGFTLLNPAVQEITILPDADSPPIVFDVRPQQAGHATLTIDFLQGNDPVGTVTLPVEVTTYDVVEDGGERPQPRLWLDAAAPPDLVLHIATQSNPPALVFTLIRDGGAWLRTFAPVPINMATPALAAELYRTIASLVDSTEPTVKAVLGKRLQIPAADVDRRVRQLGQNLWRNLIPAELKALYAAERPRWQDATLLLFSDEPYLPWELLWPYDDQGAWTDSGPWCETLLLTRWLRKDAQGNGNERPPATLPCAALAVLAPTYSLLGNLAGAQVEQDLLRGLLVQHNLQNVSPATPTWSAVVDLLEGGAYDWLHAAAHGNFYAQSPDSDSALWLQQDQALTPDALVGPAIEGHLRRQRPAFFFNACQVGRQEWALTRIGGWANRLVSGGASLFVGPLWEVSDSGALMFARAFYTALLDGETVATATRRGRGAARAAGDPTWAAYSVYAHPNARLAPKSA